ncbi:MAG: TonB-dependent receptor [Prevotella sp.]|nr:TonB-dependent receptor [Prevotella sp.]
MNSRSRFNFYFPVLIACFVFVCCFMCSSPAYAQTQDQITGTVVDDHGDPVIGATISVNGKARSVTDLDGDFKVVAKPGMKLTVSYIGFKPKTFTAKAGGMRISLASDVNQIQEVQVVGYGVQKKVTVTGAVSSVSGNELAETPTGSINNMLAGAVTGLSSVQVSGEPGSDAATLYIRGKGTFNSSGQAPLLQVDGVERSFNDLDPNDIESITVLKDASATAVYGVRGANGVILVTTKRGKEGKARVSFSTNWSVVAPSKPLKLANSYEYATFRNLRDQYDFTPTASNPTFTPVFSDAVVQAFKTHSNPILYPDLNWINFVLDKSTLQTQHNMNISGGTKDARYFISVGAFTQDGMFHKLTQPYDNNYSYQRFNYRANLDLDVTSSTTLSMNLSGIVSNKRNPRGSQGPTGFFKELYYTTPFSSPGIIDGKYVVFDGTCSWLPFQGATGANYYGAGYYKQSVNTLDVDMILKQKLNFITEGLSFQLKGSYNSSFLSDKDCSQSLPTYTPVVTINTDGTQNIAYKMNGALDVMHYSTGTGKGRNWYMDASINYDHNFGLNHVGALLLYNQSKTYYPRSYPAIPTGYVGLVGRLAYDWNNRYMAEFDFGYNGSENFAKNKRFGKFPAVSAGWVFTDEPWLKPITRIVSFGKLRVTYGVVGNDKIGGKRFMYLPDPYYINDASLLNRGGRAYDFGISGAIQNAALEAARNNPDVTWEKAHKQNYGIDLRFFKDRLGTTFDYYVEHRDHILLYDQTAPDLIGFTLPAANLGKVKSWGWEVSLSWDDRIGNDIKYNLGLNLSDNENKILEEKEAPQDYAYQMAKGHRIGARSLYKFWRFYYKGCEADYQKEFGEPFPTQFISDLRPGDAVYVDLNHDGKIDSDDASRGLSKNTDDPHFILGFNTGFTWKDLSVSARWTGAFGVSRMLGGTFMRPFHSNVDNDMGGLLQYMYDNTWTEDHTDAFYPRPTGDRAAAQNYINSTLYEVNASYLRLKSFIISYNLHFPFLQKLKIQRCAVSFSGYNMLTFTSFKWGDPESQVTDAPQYPLTKTYSLGLQINF